MTRARHPLPTDLVALIAHDGRVYPNEAKTWDRMGKDQAGPHPLETALEQWLSFATGKHTWVSVRGAHIRGLISARKRAKRSAWEVDCLIDTAEDRSVTSSLLERMVAGAAKEGAERIFLRVSADSSLVQAARDVGFFAYDREVLYRCDTPALPEQSDLPLRPASKSDAFGIYQLYSAVAPPNVRAIDGPTFKEWQAARQSWGGRSTDFVLEENGIITAWLRVLRGQDGRFAIMVRPDRRDGYTFLTAALARLQGKRPLLYLAPAWDSLAGPLQKLGFSASEEYTAMAKRTVKYAEQLATEPVTTSTTVTAG